MQFTNVRIWWKPLKKASSQKTNFITKNQLKETHTSVFIEALFMVANMGATQVPINRLLN